MIRVAAVSVGEWAIWLTIGNPLYYVGKMKETIFSETSCAY